MKIVVVSDTHNNWINFKKVIDWAKKEKIELILHCGDIQTQQIIDSAVKDFTGEIKFVKGNGDHGLNLPEIIELKAGNKKIAFAHMPDLAKKTAQSNGFDLVFYGHTHRPWDEKVGNCHLINPGELAGHFYKPSFAVYDTTENKLELKILEQL